MHRPAAMLSVLSLVVVAAVLLGTASFFEPQNSATAIQIDALSSPTVPASETVLLEQNQSLLIVAAALCAKWHGCGTTPSLADLLGALLATTRMSVDGAASCWLALSRLTSNFEDPEDTVDIVERSTYRWGTQLEDVLPYSCRESAIAPSLWRNQTLLRAFQSSPSTLPDRDYVLRSQLSSSDRPSAAYVAPHERSFLHDLPVKTCNGTRRGFTLHPISFGIPEELIVRRPYGNKPWPFYPFKRRFDVRKRYPRYVFGENDEFISTEILRRSLFAFTHRRGGWDCFRHYEILAAGSIPYFADLAQCDRLCLPMLPKHLLDAAMSLPGVRHLGRVRGPHRYLDVGDTLQTFADPHPQWISNSSSTFWLPPKVHPPTLVNLKTIPIVDMAAFNRSAYDAVVAQLLHYTRRYLTTRSIVAYLLHRVGHEEPAHVLFVARNKLDYMEMTLEHGMAALGINYTTNAPRPHGRRRLWTQPTPPTTTEMERYRSKVMKLYRYHGTGYGFGMRLPPLWHNHSETDILRRLRQGEFDLVIYGYIWHPITSLPYFADALRSVGKDRIVVVDGNDNLHDADYGLDMAAASRHVKWLFRRELDERPCP